MTEIGQIASHINFWETSWLLAMLVDGLYLKRGQSLLFTLFESKIEMADILGRVR